jgi:hypothetical protein
MVDHTPGPWAWKVGVDAGQRQYRLSPGVLVTDDTDGTPWGDEIDQANARLTVAAPDLLAALKALHLQALQSTVNSQSNEWGQEALHIALHAIAKAEGRHHA